MGLNFGSDAVAAAYLGGAEISAAYLGRNLLWPPHRDFVVLMRQPFSPGEEAGKFPQHGAFPIYERDRYINDRIFEIGLKNENDESMPLAQGDFTLEFWFRTTGYHEYYNVKSGVLGTSLGSARHYDGRFYLRFINANGGVVSWKIEFAFARLSDDIWHHLAVVRSGRIAQVFIDGRYPKIDTLISHEGIFVKGEALKMIQLISYPFLPDTITFDAIMLLDEIAVFDYARYRTVFTPPTEPYSSTTPIQE